MKKSVIAGIAVAAAITVGSLELMVMQKNAVNATESAVQQKEAGMQQEEKTDSAEEGKNEANALTGAETGEKYESEMLAGISAIPGSKIAVVSKCVKGEFISLVESGMEQAVSDANEALGFSGSDKIHFTMEGPKNELDIETQINTLDAVISENPDVLCISIGDRTSCLAQLEMARENGIPVVLFDTSSDFMDLVSGYRASDNLEIGRIGAEKLCTAIGESGTVAIIAGQERTSTTADRVAGFTEVLRKYPNVRVAATIYEDQVEDIEGAIRELLDSTPDLSGVFCTRAEEADLYLSIEKPENAPVMIGVDATKEQQKAIRNGAEYGCVSQDAWQIGYNAMMIAVELTDPETKMKTQTEFLDPGWIDAETIDLEENKRFLF